MLLRPLLLRGGQLSRLLLFFSNVLIAGWLLGLGTAYPAEKTHPTRPCFSFDITQHKSSEEIKRVFDACHPVGSDASEILKQLSSELSKFPSVSEPELLEKKIEELPSVSKIEHTNERFDFQQRKMVTIAVFSKLTHIGNGNQNAIFVNLLLSPNNTIYLSRAGVRYFDRNFMLRRIPFQFKEVTLTKERLKAVLLTLAGKDVTPENIRQLMTHSGARYTQTSKFKETIRILYTYEDSELNNFYDRFFNLKNEFNIRIVWVFGKSGNFIELMIP